jgi:hypothetical protein
VSQKWDVFFSHSTRTDPDAFAERVIEAAYHWLTGSGRRVFWDRESGISDPMLVQALRDRLDRSRAAVLFISPLFWDSGWAELELDHMARLLAGGRLHVLCVRTALGERVPQWVSTSDVLDLSPDAPVSESVRLICARLDRVL